ncbi:MAG: manganese efflux pump [Bacteroidales bacterium]|nr:manganese efflux pump [Bacteroidales bacterium]
MKKLNLGSALWIALIFALVHIGLLFAGWAFGDVVAAYVEKAAHWIGFLLLLFVGGSMLAESFRRECEVRDLGSLRNILLGAVATSIDAMAVGASLSMEGESLRGIAFKSAVLFVFTIITVVTGMFCGHRIGHRYGKIAQGIGGIVLIFIGLNVLFGWI